MSLKKIEVTTVKVSMKELRDLLVQLYPNEPIPAVGNLRNARFEGTPSELVIVWDKEL